MRSETDRVTALFGARALWACGVGLLLAAGAVRGEVTFDGSLGEAGTLTGFMSINADRGQIREGNLFHSFSVFNVGAAEAAVFNGPESITRVLARVTGSGASTIDGFLQSTISGADLYLMNPNGVIVSENAFIAVDGALVLTTASNIELGPEGLFPADIDTGVQLVVDAPSAFGFLDVPGEIQVTGGDIFPLAVAPGPGEDLVLAGGNVTINRAQLAAPDSSVDIAAVGGAGRVAIGAGGLTMDAGTPRANVTVSSGAIDVSGAGAGTIRIQGGQFVFEDSFAFADNFGTADGVHAINLDFDTIAITSNGPQTGITTDSLGDGAGGTVTINANSVSLTANTTGARAFVGASSLAGGVAGGIDINAGSLTVDGGLIITSGSASGVGGGTVDIDVTTFDATAGGALNAFNQGSGAGSNVTINASERVRLAGGSSLQIGSTGSGATGTLAINTGSFEIDGADSQIFADALATGTSTGTVAINATSVALSNGGRISLETVGADTGQPLTINADTTTLSGADTTISVVAFGAGRAGAIAIDGVAVNVRDGALVSARSEGEGGAGDISVNAASTIEISGGTINASSLVGGGGSIGLTAGEQLRVAEGGQVTTSVNLGDGVAGTISVDAPQILIEDGIVSAETGGSGRGGSVFATAGTLAVGTSGSVSVSTTASGDAGNLQLASGVLTADGTIASRSTGMDSGAAGSITITTDEFAGGVGSLVTATTESNRGDNAPGNITLTAGTATFAGELSAATAGAAPAGSVMATADTLAVGTSGSVSVSTTASGDAGSLQLGAGGLTADGTIASRSTGVDSGAAGSITITADEFTGSAGSLVTATTESNRSDNAPSNVALTAGTATLAGELSAATAGAAPAGNVILTVDDLSVDGSVLATTSGSGAGGSVGISGTRLVTGASAQISVSTTGAGSAGRMDISTGAGLVHAGTIASRSTGASAGSAGSIAITAESFTTANGASISASTESSRTENTPANVAINVASLQLDGAEVTTTTSGAAPAGNIQLTVGRAATLDGTDVVATTSGAGRGGSVSVRADRLQLRTSNIAATTTGDGDAGDVTLTVAGMADFGSGASVAVASVGGGPGAAGRLQVGANTIMLHDGAQVSAATASNNPSEARADVTLTARRITLADPTTTVTSATSGAATGGRVTLTGVEVIEITDASVTVRTDGSGNAGGIRATADSLTLTGTARLSANTTAAGDAGTIDIQTGTFGASGGAVIDARTSGAGRGGSVSLAAGNLALGTGASINTTTTAAGRAGDINIRVSGPIVLTDPSTRVASDSGAGADGSFGTGGNVLVAGDSVSLKTGAEVSATASGSGFAGNVSVIGTRSIRLDGANVRTSSLRSGGGNVDVQARELIRLDNAGIVASAGGANRGDDGGNVNIDPELVLLRNGQILARANAGDGGAIFITADTFVADRPSVIDATSQLGNDGEITIASPNDDVSAEVGLLDTALRLVPEMLADPCAANANIPALAARSSFVVAGATRVGWMPEDYLARTPAGDYPTGAGRTDTPPYPTQLARAPGRACLPRGSGH